MFRNKHFSYIISILDSILDILFNKFFSPELECKLYMGQHLIKGTVRVLKSKLRYLNVRKENGFD